VKNVLIDPVTLAFDLSASKPSLFYDIPRSFPAVNLNSLGSFVFELCCGQTDKQTDKQTDGLERPTHADQHSRRG